jgi:signal transduction histidine kinase/ligand-binding sensor domain-containing protein/DNA-binding response OmpR family regulator
MNMVTRYFYLIICISLLFKVNVAAYPIVTNLGIDQGLSNNSVRAIFQDHRGFMWFGTFDGLNRFDGYNFKIFRNKVGDSSSLINNYIFAIEEDRQSNLWIGTQGGVSVYNNLTGKFSPVYFSRAGNHTLQKITFGVRTVKADGKGNVFLGTLGEGLLMTNEKGHPPLRIPLSANGRIFNNYDVQTIKPDGKGGLIVFVPQFGICLFDYATKKLGVLNGMVKHAFSIQPDGNRIWIGTTAGLFVYDRKTNLISRVAVQGVGQLTGNAIPGMTMDDQHQLWLAINGGGVNIYQPQNKKISYLTGQNGKSALSSDLVYVVYKDKESRMWIGTFNGGINIVDPQKYKFNTISNDPGDPQSLPINYIFSFYEAPDRKLWIGTDGGGLAIWDRRSNRFKQYKNSPDPQSISNNVVLDILADSQKNIWLATFGGINKYDPASDGFIHYKCINPLTGLENQSISTLTEDQQHTLWAGTLKGGGSNGALYKFNRGSLQFDAFDTNLSDLQCLLPDRADRLWAGMLTQLVQIDRAQKKHRFYDFKNYIRSIYEDKKGRFWIGTEGGGLFLFDRAKYTVTARYTISEGLCNNSVLNILEDNQGYLWLSTFNGLSKFDPQTKVFKNFYKSDGLQNSQFHYNARYKLASGELVFGGISGLNMFLPEQIKSVRHLPNLVMSGVLVNNIPLESNSSYVQQKDPDRINRIEVPYNQAVFEFQFTALEFTAPDKIKYAYMMEGWDHDWHYTGDIRTATYTHMDGGTYTFKVKCTDSEGQWVATELQMKIHVLPPWYLSWWAIIIYVLLIGSAGGLYLTYKSRQARLKYEVSIARINMEKEKAERGRIGAELDLERAKNELERSEFEKDRMLNVKEKELNEKRLSFFTNISHEFRTPLTLIINPAKALIKNRGDGQQENEINVIYRNARRMLSLVDQLLHFRKADTSAERLFPSKLNFYHLSREVFLCFTQQAGYKNINYQFNCINTHLELYADKSKMEIMLYNLLSNALKYTPAGGSVSFSITESTDEIVVTVKDSGNGIKTEAGNQIFEKFYQSEDNSGVIKPGFGIGLYLVKHFAEAHSGEVTYQSEQGEGTTFTLTLLKGNSHFEHLQLPEDIVADDTPIIDEVNADMPVSAEISPVNPYETELFSERKSILVTDDDDDFRKYTADLFSSDFNVYEAASGEEGLSIAKQYLPDIIISDITMQGISGIDFCRAVKEDAATAHIPIILLTGTSSPELKLEGVEGGADDYITKPFDKEYLVARVNSLLKSRNKLQNYFYNRITLNNRDTIKVSAEYKEFIEKCIAIVEQYLDDTDFNVTTLQNEIGMSHSNLYRKVKSVSGVSVTVFIRLIRLRKAAELMIKQNHNVNEICMMVGFNSPNYFRQQFQKLFGMKPSEYIRIYRGAFGDGYALNNKNFSPYKK